MRKKHTEWWLTNINNKLMMTRVDRINNWVEERDLNIFERIYYIRQRRNLKRMTFVKEKGF